MAVVKVAVIVAEFMNSATHKDHMIHKDLY